MTKTLAEKEENLFLSALVKAIDKTKKEELSTDDKERLDCLKKVMKLLPAIRKKQTTAEETVGATTKAIREFLDVPKNDSLAILKTLIVLGAVRIHPAVTYQIKIDNSSLFFQWLCDWK